MGFPGNGMEKGGTAYVGNGVQRAWPRKCRGSEVVACFIASLQPAWASVCLQCSWEYRVWQASCEWLVGPISFYFVLLTFQSSSLLQVALDTGWEITIYWWPYFASLIICTSLVFPLVVLSHFPLLPCFWKSLENMFGRKLQFKEEHSTTVTSRQIFWW